MEDVFNGSNTEIRTVSVWWWMTTGVDTILKVAVSKFLQEIIGEHVRN